MNATVTFAIPRDEVNTRLQALGWSQNELARRIRKDPGLVSRVLAGKATSAVVWKRIHVALARGERRLVG